MEIKRLFATCLFVAAVIFNGVCSSPTNKSGSTTDNDKIKWGPRLGLTMSWVSPELHDRKIGDINTLVGFRCGIGSEFRLDRSIWLHIDAIYAEKGFSTSSDKLNVEAKAGYFYLPVYLSFKIATVRNVMIRAEAGFYASGVLCGKVKRSDIDYKYKFTEEFYGADYGGVIGIRAYYSKFLLDVSFEPGITHLGGSSGLDFRNRSLSVTLGYNF